MPRTVGRTSSRPRTTRSRRRTPRWKRERPVPAVARPSAEVRCNDRRQRHADVIEMGNTEMTKYMAAGAFADLTSDEVAVRELADWLSGLAARARTAASSTASRTTPARA
jgi:hypothetical protein